MKVRKLTQRTRLLAVALLSLLLVGLTACNGDEGDNGNGTQNDVGTPDMTGDTDPGADTEDDTDGNGAVANIQIIHNSPDPAAAEVDVWARIGGSAVLAVDNLGFRQATPHLTVPADTAWDAVIALPNSNDDDDGLAQDEIVEEVTGISLAEGTGNLAIANGHVDPSGFEGNQPISIDLKQDIRISPQGDDADIQLFHGSPDAPANVDVAPANLLGDSPVADDLAYGDFSGYVSLSGTNVLDIGTSSGEFVTNVQTPEGLASDFMGGVFTAVASGFLTTGGDDPDTNGFGIVVFPNNPSATDTAGVADLPVSGNTLIDGIPLGNGARAQLFHAVSADAFSEVNVSVNGNTVAENFSYTSASPFLSLPVETDLNVEVNSTSGSDDLTDTLSIGDDSPGVETVGIFARGGGNEKTPGFTPIAARESTPVNSAAPDGQLAFNVYHGATGDAVSSVEVSIRPSGGGAPIVTPTQLSYDNALGVSEITATTNAFVRLTAGGTDYDFSLSPLPSGLGGTYATFYAIDKQGQPATVYAANEDGVTFELALQQ